MAGMFRQMFANAALLGQIGICIWLVVWSIRRRGDMDEKLDRTAKAFRWAVVGAGWILAAVPGGRLGPPRAVAGVLGLAFLCWPNLAYHFVNFLRREKQGTV